MFVFTLGVYKFCVDNSHSRFSSKVVFMYILAYDMKDWSKHDKDIEDFDDSVGNVTVSECLNVYYVASY